MTCWLLLCLVGSIKHFIFMIVFFDSHCSWYLMTDSFLLLFLWFEGFRYNIWACMALHCRHKLWFLCHSLIGRFLVLLRWQGLHSSLQNCRPATCSAAMRPGNLFTQTSVDAAQIVTLNRIDDAQHTVVPRLSSRGNFICTQNRRNGHALCNFYVVLCCCVNILVLWPGVTEPDCQISVSSSTSVSNVLRGYTFELVGGPWWSLMYLACQMLVELYFLL